MATGGVFGPVAAGASSTSGTTVGLGQVTSVPGAIPSGVTPVDGRLRTPDDQLVVTAVAWPSGAAAGFRAPGGDRLVFLTLSLTAPVSLTGANAQAPTAALTVGSRRAPVALDELLNQVDNSTAASGSSGSGTGSFVAAVPDHEHEVELSVTEAGVTQSFSLWTLRRVGPVPAVLYRDPQQSSVTDAAGAQTTIDVTDPSSGLDSPQTWTLTSAVLADTTPAGTPVSDPNQASLQLQMQADYVPQDTAGGGWGTWLANFQPLPGDRLELQVPGQAPITASTSAMPASATPSSTDDGLLDQAYSFTVPAGLTSGTVVVTPGPVTGSQYQTLLAGPAETDTITAAASLPVQFPPAPSQKSQPLPHWPALATTSLLRTVGHTNGKGTLLAGALVAVVLLSLVGGGLWRRRTAAVIPVTVRNGPPPTIHGNGSRPLPALPPARPDQGADPGAAGDERGTGPHATSSADEERNPGPQPADLPDVLVEVLGPIRITGWQEPRGRRILHALLCYLALHRDRPRTADEIIEALWPVGSGRADVTRETIHSYVSALRRLVGPEALPLSDGGYQLTDRVRTDWDRFRALVDGADEDDADSMGRLDEALALVRGVPFAGAKRYFDWAAEESFVTDMTVAIVDAAHRRSAWLLSHGDPVAAEAVARQVTAHLKGELQLWEDVVRAASASGDTSRLRRAWRDLRRALDEDSVDRLVAALTAQGDHRPTGPRAERG